MEEPASTGSIISPLIYLIPFFLFLEPTPSEACQEVSQPLIPANEEIPSTSTAEKNVAYEFNSPFRDSPFFKVPLPPQPIKKAFTLRKFVASSNLRQSDKSFAAAEEEAPTNQTSVRKRKKSNSRSSTKEDKNSPPKKKSKVEKNNPPQGNFPHFIT